MVDFVPLNQLVSGQPAEISDVKGEPGHVHRLHEFGLRCGTRIQMFRPGNPCIIRMAGSKVCVRMNNSLQVLVKPISVGN
ncbi:MAG: ferrous iron transport protein A [Pirellulales bacterium]|nr:ferrous iron transport protein A [Pirellulales bacterium]